MKHVTKLLCVALLVGSSAVWADAKQDAQLEGYVRYILEEELQWTRYQYRLEIKAGAVTIAIADKSPMRRAEVIDALSELTEIKDLKIIIARTEELDPSYKPERKLTLRERLLVGIGADPQFVALPQDSPFLPLLADPKQPQFSMSYLHVKGDDISFNQLSVGFGEGFGFYRRPGNAEQGTWQIGIMGGLFGQFGLGGEQSGLINHDFNIGLTYEYQREAWSWRSRFYHQSSHLGDEFLLQNRREKRYDFNFESLEWIGAYQWTATRLYLGGEYLVDVWPFPIERAVAHGGAEYKSASRWFELARWVAGLDAKAWQEHDWQPDLSVKAGLEFGEGTAEQRQLRILLEGYHGYAPYGQFFYQDQISSVGLGLYFGF